MCGGISTSCGASAGGTAWSSRATLEVVIDVLAIISRADLKKVLIKELERHATTLEALARSAKVDQSVLGEVLGEVRSLLVTLRAVEYAPGHELRNDELLSAVRQRSTLLEAWTSPKK